jgi:hypothetical protein
MKQVIGAIFQLAGLIAGGLLVASPFGVSQVEASALVWFAFPCGCVAGHLLLISGGGPTEVRLVSTITGGGLLFLALIATAAQFAVSAGILVSVADSFVLWFVASGGFVLGGMAWSLRNYGRKQPADFEPAVTPGAAKGNKK